jgi:SLOG in TRPM, prokaryote
MEKPVRFTFSNGRTALAVHVQHSEELPAALHELGLRNDHPVLVLVGGASKMDPTGLNRLRSLFVEGLVPVVTALGAVVIDGGTDAGVMQLMGRARATATFPLIGVAPTGKVIMPGLHHQGTPLEPHHTHFVLTPGTKWGDESSWLAQVASILAGGVPSLTVLINGGDIAWQDVSQSVHVGRSVLIIGGSGRTADTLVNALRGQATDHRANELVASGLLRVVDLMDSLDVLVQAIREVLSS